MARGPTAPRPPRPRSPSALPPAPALPPPPPPGGRWPSVRGRRSASPPLSAAARQASHAGRPGRVPALSASLLCRWTSPPSLLQSPRCLPQALLLPPGASAHDTNARSEQQRQPRLQRRPRRWRQLGLRGAGLLNMRMRLAFPPPPACPPPREWSWGLNYPLRKSQTMAKFLPPQSPGQSMQLLLRQLR
ncbi:PREDICTED: uncharacterized protein LOC101376616 [Odobenus rosmarus divergens]|uniref:Uncharacterized protein LOC101376616 n=1 Tax=Odobenus rosmarus divergens TaxID=9708 RepID=A0A9B0M0D5_ODORO